MTSAGIIANPASGRDIRRLVSGASVFDNAEKGNMVYRLMVGLGAVGVERVVMMPGASGISESLRRNLLGNSSRGKAAQALPELEVLKMRLRHDARDTAEATEEMCERDVSVLIVLGGDGTNRIVAGHCGKVPLCPLSTGTNNAFPEMREATVAGIASGLVATGRVKGALRREKLLRVAVNGAQEDLALVDVATSTDAFVGARALWRPADVSEVFVTRASPESTGFSAVAGLIEPVPPEAPYGLHLRLVAPGEAKITIPVPLAPGLVAPVGVAESRRLEPEEEVELAPFSGCVALDGERELEVSERDRVTVRLDPDGPFTIDVGKAMREAALRGLMNGSG